MIKKEKNKFVLYSKDGSKKLGTFDTKEEAEEREAEINRIKHAKAEIELIITKAVLQDDGTMRWQAVASDTDADRTGERTSLSLFQDWIHRVETGKSASFLPPPRSPFLGVSHYPDLDGEGEAGATDKMYVDGNRFKSSGIYSHTPLGKALFEATRHERELIQKGEPIEQPIRISAGWWDITHAHGDFIFERKSLADKCPMCEAGSIGDKTYLKGQLDHFAATRVPINPRTSLTLEEKSMAKTTRKDDAASIVGDELAEELEGKAKPLGKSETELPDGMVVKADEEKAKRNGKKQTDDEEDEEMIEDGKKKKKADVEKMPTKDEEHHGPFGGATTLAEADAYLDTAQMRGQLMSNWGMLQGVMQNIMRLEDASEMKAKLQTTMSEFSDRVDALKSALSDAYLLQPIGDDIMANEQNPQPDQAATLDSAFEQMYEALATPGDRSAKLQAAQSALEAVAEAVKADVDRQTPPDPGEAIAKAFTPIVEKMDLLLAKLDPAQPAVIPQQKSLTPAQVQQSQTGNPDGVAVSPVTGKPSSLTSMIRRSVGIQ